MPAPRKLLTILLGCAVASGLHAQVNVTTYHNDNARTGANTQETILSPANLGSTQFGKLFSVQVDGALYAQPLYLSNVAIAGDTHNVVYVATEHDSVYAIDADSGAIYQQVSLIPAGGTAVNSNNDLQCPDIGPEVGITGTPVIDLSTGTLYVVAKSKVNGSVVQYLHALDVGTLAEKFGGPSLIEAQVPGTGYDAVNGTITFNATQQNQRAGLLLDNGHVVIGWGSHCDNDPWHGWVMSYNARTLAQEAVFLTSPNDSHAGVWMSGGGLAADAHGNIYFATGNGSWNGTSDFGDSVVKLGLPANGQFPVLDYFTPYDQSMLNVDNNDLGSGGLVLLPTLATGQQLLAQQSKEGTIYLLDTGNLGKYCGNLTPACSGNDPQILEEIQRASDGIWGSPAYWNGYLYWTGTNEQLSAYSFNAGGSGRISSKPTSVSNQIFAFPGPTASISSNGSSNGLVWLLDDSPSDPHCTPGNDGCLEVYAYDATNVSSLLYISTHNEARDAPGAAVRFATPTIANGKVFVGTQDSVAVYGLLNSEQAAAPTFTPGGGTYASAQSVTLSDSTSGAVIYYTIDGTTPTTSSIEYHSGTPIPVSTTTTIQAIAVATGESSSTVASATYTITTSQGGTPVRVSLSSVDNIDGIAKTGSAPLNGGLDGKGYDYAAALLGASISWAGSTFSFGTAGVPDAVSHTVIPLPEGGFSTLNFLGTAVNGNQVSQTFIVTYTDGTTTSFKQSMSDWHTPQSYPGETVVLQMPYRINSAGGTDNRTFNLYGYSIPLNGAKTIKSLTLPDNRNVVVLAVDLVPATTGPTPAATPTFAPAPGSYGSAQSVTLSDATPGATIYYTTNGAMPTTSSAQFTGEPILVSTTTTLNALAIANGYGPSTVATGTYTITQGGAPVSVALSNVANVDAIANTGSPVKGGGIDGKGNAYAEALLGSSMIWNSATFALGVAGGTDAVSDTIITLTAGNYSRLSLLGTAVNGNQVDQSFVVTYTDGTSTTFTQSMSDWASSQGYAGESVALKMAYRIESSGAEDNRPFNLYGYSFALDTAKTAKSLKMPKTLNAVVLAIDLVP
jgi:hypothetical protein